MTRPRSWSRVLVYLLLPLLVVLLALVAGLLKWNDSAIRSTEAARNQSVTAATDSTVAILTYRYDTIDQDVAATQQRLTGAFLDAYSKRAREDVVPNARRQRTVATATVPAAASETATPRHAVVVVFISQAVKVGDAPPTQSGSSARVTLDKIADRWLVSGFDHY